MLFAALLKPMADRDYKDRVDDLNQDVQDLHSAHAAAGSHGQRQGLGDALAGAIQHLEDDELRQALLAFIQQQNYKKKDDVKKLAQHLKAQAAKKDKDIAAIDGAHMNYALAQLAIFEESKELLKKMAAQGMNLVGKFVEDAMAKTQREMGR